MYKEPLANKLLHYFRTAGASDSEYKEDIPSFVRFAHMMGTDMQTLRRLVETDAELRHAWRECEEILADRITDGALHKRLDASFSKFLLSSRFGITEGEDEREEFVMNIVVREPTETA